LVVIPVRPQADTGTQVNKSKMQFALGEFVIAALNFAKTFDNCFCKRTATPIL
jgi:hypothetical protein